MPTERDKRGKRKRTLKDTAHLTITRPLVAKYNPNCTLVSKGNKIKQKPLTFKNWFCCIRKEECDFGAFVSINAQTGRVRLEFQNRNNVDFGTEKFCCIRHRPDGSHHYIRKDERQKIQSNIKGLTTNEIAQKYGMTKKVAWKLLQESNERHISSKQLDQLGKEKQRL